MSRVGRDPPSVSILLGITQPIPIYIIIRKTIQIKIVMG